MADFASRVDINRTAQFWARFGRFYSPDNDDRAMAALKCLLGTDPLMRKWVELLHGELGEQIIARPRRIKLVQIEKQRTGKVKLVELLDATSGYGRLTKEERLLYHFTTVIKGFVYFRETMSLSNNSIECCFQNQSFLDRPVWDTAKLGVKVGPDDYVAVLDED